MTKDYPFEAKPGSGDLKTVGTSAVRIDGLDKVSGAASRRETSVKGV